MLSHKWVSIVVPIGMVFANPVTNNKSFKGISVEYMECLNEDV